MFITASPFILPESLINIDKLHISGAHVRQPEHGGVRVGAAGGGPCQEDGRGAVVGALRSKHSQVGCRYLFTRDEYFKEETQLQNTFLKMI